MSFALEKVPGTLHSCEMHGKRPKKSTGNPDHAPAREKKIAISLDLSDKKFAQVIDDTWAGADHLMKGMSGRDNAPAQDIVSHKKFAELRVRVWSADGKSEVFAIQNARALGRPTLRIGAGAAKVHMSLRCVGPIASERLKTIDDHTEADVYVDVAVAQTDLEDVIDGEHGADEGHGTALTKPRPRRGKRGSSHVNVLDAAQLDIDPTE